MGDAIVRVGQRWRDARGVAEVRGIVDHCAVMRRHGRNLFLLGLDVLEAGYGGWELFREAPAHDLAPTTLPTGAGSALEAHSAGR